MQPHNARDPRRLDRGASTAVGRNVGYRVGKVRKLGLLHGDWLDCGCADGGYTVALAEGVDIEARRIEAATARTHPEGVSFLHSASESLPFADATFDGVFLNEVLEHVADESRTLGEIRRVLRPGGHVVVMSPNRLFPFEGHGMRVGGRNVDIPIPLLPWLPGSVSRLVLRARNYWPRELEALVRSEGFAIVHTAPVLPVFEVYPWMPARVLRWYARNMLRIERAPIVGQLGVSTLVVGRRPDADDEPRVDEGAAA
jgi:SAM-dependent methyltransferase